MMADFPPFSDQSELLVRYVRFHRHPSILEKFGILDLMNGKDKLYRFYSREERIIAMTNRNANKFEEVTLHSEPIFKGKIISLQVDTVRLPNGGTATREIVKHPGAVAVLALAEGKLLVVEQFRKPLEKSLIEIPAGKLEAGEDPMDAAKRELMEETGYRCDKLTLINSFYVSPGFADELLYIYAAEPDQLERGEAKPDEDEFLDCQAITLEEAQQYIREGRIHDAKTIAAVYAWQLYMLTGRFQ
jgi:ADP-ribose pyrophosphatase